MVKIVATGKRALIDKANSSIVIITSVAAFIFVFSLVATKTLISQAAYQNRVIDAKKSALTQLKTDISAVNSLKSSYAAFNSTPQNVIGGNSTGTGAKDGTNSQLILDALPSSYDFPALATSLEKIVSSQQVTLGSISGTDNEATDAKDNSSTAPTPVAMPFEVSVTGNYTAIQSLIGQFESSIRPFQIQTIAFSGSQTNLTADITAQTFYQPAIVFNLGSKVVK